MIAATSTPTRNTKFEKNLVRQYLSGRYREMLSDLCSIDPAVLDTEHHACPNCGGTDRFNADRNGEFEQTGLLHCNQKCAIDGDAFKAIQHFRVVDFPGALSLAGEWLITNGITTVEQIAGSSSPAATGSTKKRRQRKSRRLTHKEEQTKAAIVDTQGYWNAWLKETVGPKEPDINLARKRESELRTYAANKPGINADYLVASTARVKYFTRHGWCVVFIGVTSEDLVTGVQIVRVDGKQIEISDTVANKSQNVKGARDGVFCPNGHQAMLDALVVVRCEGPVDALAIQPFLPAGIVAITNLCGAGCWPNHDVDWLRGKELVLTLFDADIPGQEGDRKFVQTMQKIGVHTTSIRLPYAIVEDHGQDVRDWIVAGGTVEEFEKLITEAESVEPAVETKPVVQEGQPPSGDQTKAGNSSIGDAADLDAAIAAGLIIEETFTSHGCRKLVRWRSSFHRWFGYWARMEDEEMHKIVCDFLGKNYFGIGNSHIASVTSFLKSEAFLNGDIEPNTWVNCMDRGYRIAVDNGLLNPATAQLEEPTPNWFSPVVLPGKFDPHAKCDRWLSVLSANLEGDLERMQILQEFSGYLLWPTLVFQKFLLLTGFGCNGKSVFIAGLQALLGHRNVSNYALETLGNNRFAASGTIGKLANLCADLSEIDKTAEGALKMLVSGDRMTVDIKNKPAIEARPTAKLVFSCNSLPRFRDKSSGMTRRMIVMPFNREVLASERIEGLDTPEAWEDELPGILNWALEGLHRLLKNHRFTHSVVCNDVIQEYVADNNPTGVFVEDFLTVNEDPTSYVLKSEAYAAYRHWSDNHGRRALCDAQFAVEVKRVHNSAQAGRKRINGSRQPVFYGLRLLLQPGTETASAPRHSGFS